MVFLSPPLPLTLPLPLPLPLPQIKQPLEGSRPNVNLNMVDGGGVVGRNDVVTLNWLGGGLDDEENTGSINNGRVLDGRDKMNAGEGVNLDSVKDLDPHDGMEFESKVEAFSFYKEYAKSVGFATIIKASRRSRISGKFIDAKFACTRYGAKPESGTTDVPQPAVDADNARSLFVKKKRGRINRPWSKTDCKACMHVKQQDGRWVLRSFIKEHNHEIFPDQAYYFRGQRNLDLSDNNVDAVHVRAREKKVFVAMSKQSGGKKSSKNHEGDGMNHSGSYQHLALEEGDVQVMLDQFMFMQDENPNFFYAIDLNEEQHLRNVFWVDAKGRLDYGNFGDVVFFDTTYIKNEYKLALAPFIGVNHHFQFLLLGCALLADESKTTYAWLMRAWLRAMGGHAPRVILSDQDKVLKEAIAEVFPNSRHFFCLWHILSKIPERLSYTVRQHEKFMTIFKKCVFKSCTVGQFEKRWWKMIERFKLSSDLWFQSLYEDRHKWIPIFMRENFLAGMSTAQRSESISSFFDKYMQRKTTLKEFLEQNKAFLQEIFEEEAKADFETWHKQPGLKSPSPFGKQMAALYTHAIFKKFQIEVLGIVACHPRVESDDRDTKTFRVQDFEENQDFNVSWNVTTSYICCSCHLFEFNGFLCRHVLIVLQMSGAYSIPSQYILKRWTKDAKSRQAMREPLDVVESRSQRFKDLCRRAFKLGDEASSCEQTYNIAFNALEEALRKCEKVNNSFQSVIELQLPSSNCSYESVDVNQSIGMASANKRTGMTEKKQVHPETEAITTGLHENCQQMEQLNPRSAMRNGYFGPQQIVQELGQLHSIASSRDNYHSNQHTMQGLGQLISTAPAHEPHCMTQQRYEMGQLNFRPQTVMSYFGIQDNLQEMDQSNVISLELQRIQSKQLPQKHQPE